MRTLYISGALRGARSLAAARRKYEDFAGLLACGGKYDTYLPHSQTDPESDSGLDPVAVFTKDVEALLACDAVIAFLDEPSLGVGAEISLAFQHKKVVVGIFKRGTQVSRFVEGLIQVSKGSILEYDDLQDGVELVIGELEGAAIVKSESIPPSGR